MLGLVLWVFIARRAARSDVFLWMGCALHAVWDAAHFGRAAFIPEWYAAACVAADLGVAGYVLMRLGSAMGSGLRAPGPSQNVP
ncbi:MAG: hypothetical protein AB1635_18785 [Acidobacteriota bacterium]